MPDNASLPGSASSRISFGMKQKVDLIKEELQIEPSMPMPQALKEAYAFCGVKPSGGLSEQIELLLHMLGAHPEQQTLQRDVNVIHAHFTAKELPFELKGDKLFMTAKAILQKGGNDLENLAECGAQVACIVRERVGLQPLRLSEVNSLLQHMSHNEPFATPATKK